MDINDVLWNLECEFPGNETDNPENQSISYETTRINICFPSQSSGSEISDDIIIKIHELNENGVVNPIGGELWEASLLLCCLILRNQSYFTHSQTQVLELGSGVGIPSILLVILKLRLYNQDAMFSDDCGSVYLSDYDNEVLNNLKTALISQFPESKITELIAGQNMTEPSLSVYIQKLDWNDFLEHVELNSPNPNFPNCKVIMGSELIYTNTQLGLSSLILHALEQTICEEILILQIKSRPGFQEFLSTIQQLFHESRLNYSVDEIPLWIYQTSTNMKMIISSTGSSISNQTSWEKSLWIPSHVIKSCHNGEYLPPLHPSPPCPSPPCPGPGPGPSLASQNSSFEREILHTAREEYCILKIWKFGQSSQIKIC